MDTLRRTALGSLLVWVLCGTPALASAAEPTEMVVNYADLRLDTREGAKALYARLEAAAHIVCRAYEGPALPRDRVDQCVDYSLRRAVAGIGAPRLAMLYETRSGHLLLNMRRGVR